LAQQIKWFGSGFARASKAVVMGSNTHSGPITKPFVAIATEGTNCDS